MNEKLFITFVILNIVNVIIQTVKSLATVKCGKTVASIVNAIAYGLYTVVVVYTVCDLPLWLKVVVVGVANLIGVYVVKFIEEKSRKDKLWKIECTVPNDQRMYLCYDLKEKIPFKPGSIIIVPPRVTHGSVSQNGFVNISIGGDFTGLSNLKIDTKDIVNKAKQVCSDAELLKKLLAMAVPNCVYKTSKRSGYLRPGWFAIVPYLGNLGRGWALIEHEASSVVRYHFYLEGDYRGEI